ncbi:unnamed protein product [Cochlearia groenlandica]
MLRRLGPPRPTSVYFSGMLMVLQFGDRRDQHPQVCNLLVLCVSLDDLFRRLGPLRGSPTWLPLNSLELHPSLH